MPPGPPENIRPIIIKRVRKHAHDGHHGGAWKVAYADFVTAMMAFFMLLWLLSNPDKQRLRGLAQYFSIAPPNAAPSSTRTPQPGEMPGVGGLSRRPQGENVQARGEQSREPGPAGARRGGTASVPDASLRVMAQQMKVAIDASAPEGAAGIMLEQGREGLRVSLTDTDRTAMFMPGTATPTPLARLMLQTVASRLANSSARIAIEAHTDRTGSETENWRLSAARAQAAREILLSAGLAPERVAELIALAGTRPVYPSEPNRPENRRVTIVVLAEAPPMPSDSSFDF